MTKKAGKGSSVKLKYAPITKQSAYTKAVTKAYWKAEKLKKHADLDEMWAKAKAVS
mgnify:CR=1 FL=1